MLIGDLVRFGDTEWRQQSRDLQALAIGDYTPVVTALRALFPNTQMPLRAIPFVDRYIAELTGRYARPVVRRFRSPDLGQAWQLLQDAYTEANVDGVMDAVERALVIQRSLLLVPMVDAAGILRLHICQPWQVQAEYDDPADADQPGRWRKLTIQVPQSYSAEQVIYGQAVITPDSAWRTVNAGMQGMYAADGSNPFRCIPAIRVVYGDAYPGRWHGPVNQAVLNLQIAICVQVADNELIVRNCAFPQKIIENATYSQVVEQVVVGPDKVVCLIGTDSTGPQPTMRIVQGAVPVTELSNSVDNQIRLYCAMLGLDPSPFLKSNTATTASARLFAAQDRQALQDRIKPTLQRAELQIARLWAEWLTYTSASRLPYERLQVDVTYTETAIVADPLHDAQALQLRIQLGLTSAAEVVAQERGISVTEAGRIVARHRKELEAHEPPDYSPDLQTQLPMPDDAEPVEVLA